MADALKNLINERLITETAGHLQKVAPSFNAAAFCRQAISGLAALEFKARALHVCDALQAYLPSEFEAAAELIEASLAPPTPFDAKGEPVGLAGAPGAGLRGWIVWSLGEFVVRTGLSQPERALACLHALTQRFSAEFAIRPFLLAHPTLCYATLARWASDPSAHVRRLVSEGSRPRLPWGIRLQPLIVDPTPSWPLLQALQDDESAYVRRSVANHLNDIAKDHPDVVARWLKRQLENAPKSRVTLLRHASRSLIKKGHAPTLAAWNVQQGFIGTASLSISPATVIVGEALTINVALQSEASVSQALVVDYAVHFVMANGKRSVKVYKGWKRDLAAGQRCLLQRVDAFKKITTRRYYSGEHRLELLINGHVLASSEFQLQAPP